MINCIKKGILLLVTIVGLINASLGQPLLVGACKMGGNQFGTIMKYAAGDTMPSDIFDFQGNTGSVPNPSMCVIAGGKLYGMTYRGGFNDAGFIFEYNLNTNTFIEKFNLSLAMGMNPRGSLMLASNGKLYGMTSRGGTNDEGVIFEYDYNTNNFIKKIDLSYANGSAPWGSLMQASNGKLYGMTQDGGLNGNGVIFEYDYNTNTYVKKIDLQNASGDTPYGTLIQASNGNLFGLTNKGGANNCGVIFEYNYINNTYTKKFDFSTSNGSFPKGNLIQLPNGKLYGMTNSGGLNNGGVIFEYNLNNNTFLKLVQLDFSTGKSPDGSLLLASNGKLYGVAGVGGANNEGVLFEYDYINNIYILKIEFASGGVNSPKGTLVQDTNGKLYGTTSIGTSGGSGVLYEFDYNNNSYSSKYEFSVNNGCQPFGNLVKVSNGKLYGMTSLGGVHNVGVIYEFDYTTNIYVKKFDFGGNNGNYPFGSLIQASNGKLYGMTKNGGSFDFGVIFEYDYNNNNFVKKYDLTDLGGAFPSGSLFQASNGKLYGLAHSGGNTYDGVIFEYDFVTNTYSKKIDLEFSTGGGPTGSLIQANNGKLYGMAGVGGNTNDGVIFEYDYVTNSYVKKIDLDTIIGSTPSGSLLLASNGKMYGMTRIGGANNGGVIFEYDYINNLYLKKFDFSSISGQQPTGSLMEASNGKLYGTTTEGGIYNGGTVFEYDFLSNNFIKKIDLQDSVTGSCPISGFIEVACATPHISASGPTSFCQGDSVILNAVTAISSGITYQWKRNGNIIQGASGQNISVTIPGKYTVTITDSTCSSPQTSNYIRIRVPCIPPIEPQEKIQLNADEDLYEFYFSYETATQSVSITASELQGSGYQISIFDNTGRLLLSESGKIENSEIFKQFNCASFTAGLYFIKLVTDKEQIVRKFLKHD